MFLQNPGPLPVLLNFQHMPRAAPLPRVRSLFTLEMGPYRFRVELVDKAELHAGNEISITDVNAGWIRIANHLVGKKLIEAFLVRLVDVIHYTHGLDDASTEEHFTHSFAVGVLEFASRNHKAWYWLNRELSRVGRAKPNFEEFARGQHRQRLSAPLEVQIGQHTVNLAAIAGPDADREGVWGYYVYRKRGVRLHEELTGRHLAVIILHELTHAFHHAAGMRTREKRRRFTRVQATAWLRFICSNPEAWCWFVQLLRTRKVKAQALWPIEPLD